MTIPEVKYVVETLGGADTSSISPFLSLYQITLTKRENKFIDIEKYRYKFDMSNGLLYCYHCRPLKTGESQPTSNFDTINGVTYIYMTDSTGSPIADIYDFSKIVCIGLAGGK
jgi:hypothetical protein